MAYTWHSDEHMLPLCRCRKQRKLLGLLSRLDQPPPSLPTPPHTLPSQPSHADDHSRSRGLQSEPTLERQSYVMRGTVGTPEGVQGRRDGVQVQLRILSNWGHAHLVGLTEVGTTSCHGLGSHAHEYRYLRWSCFHPWMGGVSRSRVTV